MKCKGVKTQVKGAAILKCQGPCTQVTADTKSATSGVMKNLRDSTDNVKVRSYHREFYRPENLTLIIAGQVKPDEVFQALTTIEDKIILKGNRGPFTRPWQSPVPRLQESVDLKVPYPCDEEDNGMVYVAWRGPSAVKELYRMDACLILLRYLTETPVSPLQKEFVETDDPYASKVSCCLTENSESMLYVTFENVPTEKIDLVKNRLFEILGAIASGSEKLDMKRMHTVIHKHISESLNHLENRPHETVSFMIIGDMLYGNTKEDLSQRLNPVDDLHQMEKEPEEFWLQLLKKYLLDGPSVTVRGYPSLEEQQSMAKNEKQRISEQRQKFGKEGLKKLGEQLQQATVENEKPPPREMLVSVPIPSTSSINFHPIQCFTTDSAEQHSNFDLSQVPVQMQLDSVHTSFVYMFVLMDTAGVPLELRPYLPLLLESLLELPVKRGDVLVPYEAVVAQLETDTITTSTGMGLEALSRFQCGPYSHTASLMLQVEPAKYERCINWIRELLYQTQFTSERFKIIAAKIANDVAQVKRKGNKVVGDLMKGLCYSKDSNHYSSSMLRQHKFLTALIEKLDSKEKCEHVLNEIKSVHQIITDPASIVIHLAANVDQLANKIGDLVQPWRNVLPADKVAEKKKLHVTDDWTLILDPNKDSNRSCVVALGCIESSFLCQTTPCVRDFSDKNFAPILVFLQYLTQPEGPLWRQVRGLGLSYGYSIVPRPHEGLLCLSFYRATNCVSAYKEAKNIVNAQLTAGAKWDQNLFESAKSSLIFEIIEREKSVGDVVTQSLRSYFKRVDHDYNRQLVRLISQVTIDDLNQVGPKYVAPLFNPETSKTSIVCHPSKIEEIAAGFKEMGHNLKSYQTLEESFLSNW